MHTYTHARIHTYTHTHTHAHLLRAPEDQTVDNSGETALVFSKDLEHMDMAVEGLVGAALKHTAHRIATGLQQQHVIVCLVCLCSCVCVCLCVCASVCGSYNNLKGKRRIAMIQEQQERQPEIERSGQPLDLLHVLCIGLRCVQILQRGH